MSEMMTGTIRHFVANSSSRLFLSPALSLVPPALGPLWEIILFSPGSRRPLNSGNRRNEIALVPFRSRFVGHFSAEAQNEDTIGNTEDVVEIMGYENDAEA